MTHRRTRAGFTLIELLTVIGIILLVAALAMPNFIAMMKSRRWSAAVSNIQGMIMRARALATNTRHDFSVEFSILDNCTLMWIESENNEIERTPDIWDLEHQLGGEAPIRFFMENDFRNSGGNWASDRAHECVCTKCGRKWNYVGSGGTCPGCGNTGSGNDWATPVINRSYYYNITWSPNSTSRSAYGDNAKQSEDVLLGSSITIDRTHSPNFVSWDSRTSVEAYGYDEYPDIRIGVNGALVQSSEPVICLREIDQQNRMAISVVRCTGRVKHVRVP